MIGFVKNADSLYYPPQIALCDSYGPKIVGIEEKVKARTPICKIP